MLPVLLELPTSPEEWQRWSFHHREHHDEIRQAVQSQKSIILPAYPLDPIPSETSQWLAWNQQAHNDMNGAIGLQSSDLEGADFKTADVMTHWVYNHYLEHYAAAAALAI